MGLSGTMKHVIVTGGSRGLGLEIVKSLLDADYWVSSCSRGTSAELEALVAEPERGKRLFWQSCTVGEEREAAAFVAAALDWAAHVPLYGLVNNAGIASDGVLAIFPAAEMERILRINLLGSLQMARLALRTMLRGSGGGRIINISSIIGARGYSGLAAYSASKAGMDGLTRSLAREVGRAGITVNSIAPGYVETEMSANLSAQQHLQISRRTPLGRLAKVEDIVPLLRFLLSEDASFITGQTLIIDGGITC
jgi:3-oxoacyl-[acyl-carrier protein] reductase